MLNPMHVHRLPETSTPVTQVGEDELRSEFGANQDESRQAVSFAGKTLSNF